MPVGENPKTWMAEAIKIWYVALSRVLAYKVWGLPKPNGYTMISKESTETYLIWLLSSPNKGDALMISSWIRLL